MDQFFIYLRKSRADLEAENRGEGETLARHEKALLELAQRLNINVTKIFREVVSGETIAARPEMQKVLAEVERGIWDGCLVMDVDRLARGDTMDQGLIAQTFKYSSTKIITPTKTYDPNNEYDEEFFEYGLFMSRQEYKKINRRLQRGRIASVSEGKYVANNPPYGYKRIKLEKAKGYTLEPDTEQAEIVRCIFDLYTKGEKQKDGTHKRLGVNLIARRLNKLNIPSKKGGLWVSSSIRDILINPVYIGKIRWNWRPAVKKMVDGRVKVERPRSNPENYIIKDGLHKGIISQETYDLAQKYMSCNSARPIGERYTIKNPLAGIVVCGKCNRLMVRRPYSGREYPDTLMCAMPECDNVSSALHYVEKAILDALREWLNDYKLQWENLPQNNNDTYSYIDVKQLALKKAEAEIYTIKKQLSSIHDLLEQGIYDVGTFIDRSHDLGDRLKRAQDDHDALAAELETEKKREVYKNNIIPKIEYLLDVYDKLPNAKQKNDLLKEVLDKVIYTKNVDGRRKGAPDDFQILLRPKLPK